MSARSDRKFDEIRGFSVSRKFIDIAGQALFSGMYCGWRSRGRPPEPDILLVDEVLR